MDKGAYMIYNKSTCAGGSILERLHSCKRWRFNSDPDAPFFMLAKNTKDSNIILYERASNKEPRGNRQNKGGFRFWLNQLRRGKKTSQTNCGANKPAISGNCSGTWCKTSTCKLLGFNEIKGRIYG